MPRQLISNLHCLVRVVLIDNNLQPRAVPRPCDVSGELVRSGLGINQRQQKCFAAVSATSPTTETQPQTLSCSFFPPKNPVTMARNFCHSDLSVGMSGEAIYIYMLSSYKIHVYPNKRKIHYANAHILLLNHNPI